MQEVLKAYFVGSSQRYDTAFWYCDAQGKPVNAKLMAYNERTAKRRKDTPPNWYHSTKDAEMPQMGFFGEHLKANNIYIVESEKTALIFKAWLLSISINSTDTPIRKDSGDTQKTTQQPNVWQVFGQPQNKVASSCHHLLPKSCYLFAQKSGSIARIQRLPLVAPRKREKTIHARV